MNIKSFDLNLLLAFESLMTERSVTRAARRVNLSQPAMSNALARLRRTFDDPLLVRTPEGMKPTPMALSVIVPVRAALSQLRGALEEKPAFDPAASERSFQLLANDYAEMLLFPPVLERISAQAVGVTLRIDRQRSLFQPPTSASLAEAHDLAVGFFPDALSLDRSIHSQFLWEEKNVCVARRDHPSVRGKISLRRYATLRHVAVFYKSEGSGVVDTILEQRGYSRRVASFVPHFATVPFIVAASDLIATMPERLALKLSPVLKLQVLPVPIAIPPFRLTMLWHSHSDRDPAHIWLRGLIAEAAARVDHSA
ncbi:MAG TPA: LysR family transcriptional regulator [Blastocatellia bacterium]|nr:LysR family transcriptional regulator [Blastocatellia bacterium]